MANTEELKVLCPFCNQPYTAEMIDELIVSEGCDTCGYDSLDGEISIICSNCEKVVYKKIFKQ